MNFKNYLKELKRRNVVKAALAYLVVAWLLIQVLSTLLPTFNAAHFLKPTVIILIIGFPIWIIFSWIFELTPEGIKKTPDIDIDNSITQKTNVKLNRIIIGGLSITVIILVVNQIRMYQSNIDNTSDLALADNRKAIAVLPLYNLTGNPDQDYLVDGMHETLNFHLGKISALRVISTRSTLRYKNNNELSLQEIAKDLDVSAIVEGSVLNSGDSIHIQLKLIEAFPKEHQLWSGEYSQDFGRILTMENQIIRDITRKMEVNINQEEASSLDKSPEVDPEAYKAYMQGVFYWNKLTSKSLETSLKYFEIARDIDPNYALAYAGIANVWVGKTQQGLASYVEALPKIEEAVEKALTLDSTSAEIYETKAWLSWDKWNFVETEIAFRKAIQLNPNFSRARAYFSHTLISLNKPEEAMQHMEMALKLDPFNSLYKAIYGMNLNFTRQYDKAIELFESALKTSPQDILALSNLRTSYHLKGMYTKALEVWKAYYNAKNDKEAVDVLAKGEAEGGYQKALEDLAELLIERSDSTFVTPWQIATIYTRAGQKDKALIWLEKAFAYHDTNMPYIGIDPIFDILKDDPRFSNLLKKMNLPVENQ